MQWSQEQQAIFTVGQAPGNLAIRARAGTGKTTTIVELAKRLTTKGAPFDRKKVVFCAFNAAIASELASRLPSSVTAKTLHSLGLSALKKADINAKVDGYKTSSLLKSIERESGRSYYGYGSRIGQLVGQAKNAGMLPNEDARHYLEAYALNNALDDENMTAAHLAGLAVDILKRGIEDTSTIDFDDMLYLPYVLDLRPVAFDLVLVDEAQDLNLLQHSLVSKLVTKSGKVVIVGDDRQAIYQWRGALDGSFDAMVRQFNAKVLPLTITRRCPKNVVKMANVYVPDFSAAEDAPEGVVTHAPYLDSTKLKNGDVVISRVNAPLMGLCLQVLLSGRRARVLGNDIGKALLTLVNKSKAESLDTLLAWLDAYKAKEAARLAGKDESLIEQLSDRVLTLVTMANAATDMVHLKVMLETLFVEKGGQADSCVTFCTAHRSKGLEFDRVFVLRDTFKGLGGDNLAEHNVYYVAITRTKQHLTVVCGE